MSIVTAGRHIPELRKSVTEVLGDAGIVIHGRIEQPREFWICIETKHLEEAQNLLHNAFVVKKWIHSELTRKKG